MTFKISHITCCALHWDNFHQHWTRSIYQFPTYNIFIADTLRHAVSLTFNVLYWLSVTWSNCVPNLSEIEQSARSYRNLAYMFIWTSLVARHLGFDWKRVFKIPWPLGTQNAPMCQISTKPDNEKCTSHFALCDPCKKYGRGRQIVSVLRKVSYWRSRWCFRFDIPVSCSVSKPPQKRIIELQWNLV